MTTGDEYVYHEKFKMKKHLGENFPYNQTWMIQSRITGKGQAPDFDIRWVVHVTFNDHGDMNIVYKLDPPCSD